MEHEGLYGKPPSGFACYTFYLFLFSLFQLPSCYRVAEASLVLPHHVPHHVHVCLCLFRLGCTAVMYLAVVGEGKERERSHTHTHTQSCHTGPHTSAHTLCARERNVGCVPSVLRRENEPALPPLSVLNRLDFRPPTPYKHTCFARPA